MIEQEKVVVQEGEKGKESGSLGERARGNVKDWRLCSCLAILLSMYL